MYQSVNQSIFIDLIRFTDVTEEIGYFPENLFVC
jgi:hypothetical protein